MREQMQASGSRRKPTILPMMFVLAVLIGIVLLLSGCPSPSAGDTTSTSDPPDLPAIPAGAPTDLSVFEMILVRDTEHAAEGETARREMLESTMLYQRLLLGNVDLYIDIHEYAASVDLNPATVSPGETDVLDYLSKFATWKQNNLDNSTRTYQPFAALYSYKDFSGTAGLSYTEAIGTASSASVVTHYVGSSMVYPDIRAALAARYIGYNLGASGSSHSEEGYIMSSTYDTLAPPTEYHSLSLADMQTAIDTAVTNRGALPVVAGHPLGVLTASESVTLAWDFGGASSTFTVYRSDAVTPLSCFDCTVATVGSQKYFVDTSVSPGSTYHYRVAGRTSSGDLTAVSKDTVVHMP